MRKQPKILVLSSGDFSGVRPALCSALRDAGCEVVDEEASLRKLPLRPWHVLLMALHALIVYGRDFQRYIGRTYSAYAARSKACHAIATQTPGIDAVILLQVFAQPFWGKRLPGVRYAVYTDHANLMSKHLPDTGYDIPEKRIYARWNDLECELFRSMDRVFVMAKYVKPALIDLYGVDPGKIAVVGAGPGIGVDISAAGVRKDYTRRNLLFVGKAPGRKGLDTAIRALEHVRVHYPDTRLHVVGSHLPDGEGITCHGRIDIDRLKELFYDAQIFVFPAHREPLGLVLLEAMWSKAVCIGTTTGAMPELIQDGVTGHIVAPGDDQALADLICGLFDDPVRMQIMAEAGHQAARTYWSWNQVAQRILDDLLPEKFEGSITRAEYSNAVPRPIHGKPATHPEVK